MATRGLSNNTTRAHAKKCKCNDMVGRVHITRIVQENAPRIVQSRHFTPYHVQCVTHFLLFANVLCFFARRSTELCFHAEHV